MEIRVGELKSRSRSKSTARRRVRITIDVDTDAEIQWAQSLTYAIRGGIFFASDPARFVHTEKHCRYCGCTEDRPCSFGVSGAKLQCFFEQDSVDVCSACANGVSLQSRCTLPNRPYPPHPTSTAMYTKPCTKTFRGDASER
jgi:hypothetical protein